MILSKTREAWIQMGLENVHLAEYDFYLSWPNQTNPNKVYLIDDKNQVETSFGKYISENEIWAASWIILS